MQEFSELFKAATRLWYVRNADLMAAAVSYYAMFAVVPLVFMTIYIVGSFFGEDLVANTLVFWGEGLGQEVSALLTQAVQNLDSPPIEAPTPWFGLLLLIGAVVVFFNALSEGFHQLWGASPVGVQGLFRKSLHALYCILILQAFIATMVAAEFFFAISLDNLMFTNQILMIVYLVGMTALFTIFYGVLPTRAIPSFYSRLYGGFLAAIGFVLMRQLVWLYLMFNPVPDLFGAASVVVILLLWVYLSTALIYFGAAFAFVHSHSDSQKVIL